MWLDLQLEKHAKTGIRRWKIYTSSSRRIHSLALVEVDQCVRRSESRIWEPRCACDSLETARTLYGNDFTLPSASTSEFIFCLSIISTHALPLPQSINLLRHSPWNYKSSLLNNYKSPRDPCLHLCLSHPSIAKTSATTKPKCPKPHAQIEIILFGNSCTASPSAPLMQFQVLNQSITYNIRLRLKLIDRE